MNLLKANFLLICFAFILKPNAIAQVETKFLASDGAISDQYSTSVDVYNNSIIVGAHLHNSMSNNDAGAAYLYELNGMNWVETKFIASDVQQFDYYGISVAIDGSRIVIGAPKEDTNAFNAGAAYVYDWNGSSWVETKLMASDGGIGDHFGISVDIDGDRIIVGAYLNEISGNDTGAAYIYDWNGSTWVETKLAASDGEHSDMFGVSVSIDNNRAIVGAHLSDDNNSQSGSAYIYDWDGMNWVETKLTASDASGGDHFGFSVSVDDDRLAIGAPHYYGNSSASGGTYIYDWDGMSWIETILLPSDGYNTDRFGYAVSVDSDRVAVGSPMDDDNGGSSGSVYVYDWNGSTWTETKVTASDGANADKLGSSISVNGSNVLSGAPFHKINGTQVGAAYLFDAQAPSGINCNWLATIYNPFSGFREPNVLPCSFVSSGVAYIPPGATSEPVYWTGFINPNSYDYSADDVILEARVKNSNADGGIFCYDTELWIYGENNFASVGIMDLAASCEQYAYMGTDFDFQTGQTYDMTNLQSDLSSFQNIKLEVNSNAISVYKDGGLLRSMAYTNSLGDIKGLKIAFKGSGTVDWITLKEASSGTLIFEELFDNCNTICPDCNDTQELNQHIIPACVYEANEIIIGNGEIDSNNDVLFRSGQEIELSSGFEVKSGAEFQAIIGNCSY